MSTDSDRTSTADVFNRAIDRLWGAPAILTALALFVLIVTVASGQLNNSATVIFLVSTILVGLILAFVLEYRKLTSETPTARAAVETLIAHEIRDSIMAHFDDSTMSQGELIYSEIYARLQNPVGLEQEETYYAMVTGIGKQMHKLQDANARNKVTSFMGRVDQNDATDESGQ